MSKILFYDHCSESRFFYPFESMYKVLTIFIIVVDKNRFTVTMLKPIQRPRMPPELATNQITWTGGQQLPN